MRVSRVFMFSCVSMLFEAPLIAQSAPTRTVDDYVCAFAGECIAQKPQTNDSTAPGKSRGFSLSVPERKAPAADARRPAATASPSAPPARTNVAPAGRKATSTRIASRRTTARPAAAEERRMDLRLSFMLGSAELTNQAREEAQVFAKALLLPQLAGKRFLIEGHTDSSGGRALNLDLSRRRASAVAEYLNSLGVARDRLDVRGYGPDRPLQGRRASSPANRRVEAKLL